MSLLTFLIVALFLVALGVAVGSFWTLLWGVLIGAAAVLVLYATVGGIAAWRHPAHREDGAPARGSQF